MTIMDFQARSATAAVTSGTASQATVVSLRALLENKKDTSDTKASSRPLKSRTTKLANSKSRKADNGSIYQDSTKRLSPREQYALATETANSSLRVLTNALQANTNVAHTPASRHVKTPSTPPRQPLRCRTTNATPAHASPQEITDSKRTPASGRNGVAPTDLESTAECARVAFAFLRSYDPATIGVRAAAPLQLEKGMLALVSKLIAHGLDKLAIRELLALKHRLQSIAGKQGSASNTTSKTKRAPAQSETLASLLQLDIDFDQNKNLLSLAINHQQYVLRLLSTARKPALLGEAVKFLGLDSASSPASLLLLQAKETHDSAKVARQLEALSQTVLALCPPTSSSTDAPAIDIAKHPHPTAVLRLQTIALQIRKLWWKVAGHSPDVTKEFLEPLLKCLNTFVRRTTDTLEDDIYKSAMDAVSALGLSKMNRASNTTLFSIDSIMFSLSDQANRHKEAAAFAEMMLTGSNHFTDSDARRLSTLARILSCHIEETKDLCLLEDSLKKLKQGLMGRVTGNSAEYQQLVTSLASLAQVSTRADRFGVEVCNVAAPIASFTLRYSKSYPGRNKESIELIIMWAVRSCKSSSDIVPWIGEEAIRVLVRMNVLEGLAKVAAIKPMLAAWSSSTFTVSLSRLLKALVLRRLREGSTDADNTVFDDKSLSNSQRGLLLEIQLQALAELTSRQKNQLAGSTILTLLADKLNTIYSAQEFPIRRTRVAIAILRARRISSSLVSSQVVDTWKATPKPDHDNLGSDIAFKKFCSHITATLEIVKLLSAGRPDFKMIQESLKPLQELLQACDNERDLANVVDDIDVYIAEIKSVSSYFAMIGEDKAYLDGLLMLRQLRTLVSGSEAMSKYDAAELAFQYLAMGYAEKCSEVLSSAKSDEVQATEEDVLADLSFQLAHAEYLLATKATQEFEESFRTLRSARDIWHSRLMVGRPRKAYERFHAQSWLIYSQHMFNIGRPSEGLRSAKNAARLLTSIWGSIGSIEASNETQVFYDSDDMPDVKLDNTGKPVLRPNPVLNAGNRTLTWTARWPLVPLIIRAFLAASDAYVHFGQFMEATWFSEQARLVASLSGSLMFSRVSSHRAQLLALAGQIENAEFTLSGCDDAELNKPSLAAVDRLCAQAAVATRKNSLKDAVSKYAEAEEFLKSLSSDDFLSSSGPTDPSKRGQSTQSVAQRSTRAAIRKAAVAGSRTRKADERDKDAFSTENPSAMYSNPCILLSRQRTIISLRKAAVLVQMGTDVDSTLADFVDEPLDISSRLQKQQVVCSALMAKVSAALKADISLSVLLDSVLLCPTAVKRSAANDRVSPDALAGQDMISVKGRADNWRAAKKGAKRQKASGENWDHFLTSALECLKSSNEIGFSHGGTITTHLEKDLLASGLIFNSAISEELGNTQRALEIGLAIDLPRIKALRSEQQVVAVDKDENLMTWPESGAEQPTTLITANDFQEQYIDIIPKPWTAVSLCLSNDGRILYISRYRANETPLILQIPLSTGELDELKENEERFDYHHCKAELSDFIATSNRVMLQSAESKAIPDLKAKWWKERESLDRQLHKFLIGIENTWFGGFRGILSVRRTDPNGLAQFRNRFERVLGKYLPSRQSTKVQESSLALDDNILELFIGLGDDDDGRIDMDDQITELLHFMVDMLQCNGEQNAFDEVDFDAMAVDMLDALRAYHTANALPQLRDEHLILVLDRRLQAFPFESMPCLDGVGVSRVGSMLMLRECILAMQRRSNNGSYEVSPASGTYILNPDKDLKNLETRLNPVLAGMADPKPDWDAIVARQPSETEFSLALTQKSMTLYFGHGSGSQFIRSHKIRKLDSCSDVVWLMGCSSGATTEYGDLEPSAVPFAYLIAGTALDKEPATSNQDETSTRAGKCLAVVGNLWDITDKDLDRLAVQMGKLWGLWPDEQLEPFHPWQIQRKQEDAAAAAAEVVRTTKTPRTTKVHRTPPSDDMMLERGSNDGSVPVGKKSLVQALAQSRDACYLRYLNGGAAVVYGIPVYLEDQA